MEYMITFYSDVDGKLTRTVLDSYVKECTLEELKFMIQEARTKGIIYLDKIYFLDEKSSRFENREEDDFDEKGLIYCLEMKADMEANISEWGRIL